MTADASGVSGPDDAHRPDTLPSSVRSEPESPFELDPLSEAALDALIDAGWSLDSVAPELRPAASRAMVIMGLLQQTAPGFQSQPQASLVSRTLSRIASHQSTMSLRDDHAHVESLSAEESLAADAFVNAGYDASRVEESLRSRARSHEYIADLLRGGAAHVHRRGDLASRTLKLIDLVDASETQDLEPISFSKAAWFRKRAWDVVAAAAMVMVAASIMWPVLAAVRQRGMELQCGSNMQAVASAMSAYASQNHDSLPMAIASFGPQRWWDVDEKRPVANSSNLYTLVKGGYTRPESLACPGNPKACFTSANPTASDWRSLEEISYSYQLMCSRTAKLWNNHARRVILADRSPAVLRAVRNELLDPRENSPNHRGAGQHALYSDGSASWLSSSFIPSSNQPQDCIWLPRLPVFQIEGKVEPSENGYVLTLTGRELPADGSDVFLGP
ncbi:MAG TPA: hypothetical protein VK176_00615 [Phycisphaerales bacterium]|nr:hypothetical protein [Phycisphaerales bacterium]